MPNATWPIYKRLLQRSSKPILVGPFKSELGFESLYWIPFVQSLGIDPSRLIVVSRGGAAILYGATQGVEMYDLRDPKDVRIENLRQHARTGLLKQTHYTPFDKALIKDAAKAAGLTKYHVLHPLWMYRMFVPFWQGHKGYEWALNRLTVRATHEGQPVRMMHPIAAPALPEGLKLPQQFCVARFYARATLPYGEPAMQLARECLKQIAQAQPVVLLNPGVHADEHLDLPVKDIPNVIKLTDLVTVEPRNNLAIQAAVMAKSQGFVGTYGGVAQLALRMGKPSVNFYLNWQGTALAHKQLSECLSLQTGVSFLTVKLTDIPLIKTILPELSITFGSSQMRQGQQGPPKQESPEHSTQTHEEAALG